MLENTIYNGLVHHYFLLLLSGQKSRVFLKSFCVVQPEFRMDVSGKFQWHRPQEMVWATSLDLKLGSPHLPCHWHLHMQIKASATASTQAAAALQKNRRGDMTKQVKSLATCGQQHVYNYYSVLHSWTDNLANFSNSSKKAETSLTAKSVEQDHNLLCSLYYFLPIQWNLSCFNQFLSTSLWHFVALHCTTQGNNSYSGEKRASGQNPIHIWHSGSRKD